MGIGGHHVRLLRAIIASGLTILAGQAISAQTAPPPNPLAKMFGALPYVENISMSPDGRHVAFITPGADHANATLVQDVVTGDLKTAASANGQPLRLTFCGWSANDRLVCGLQGITKAEGSKWGWSRMVSVDSDGTHAILMSAGVRGEASDGFILDWLSGTDGKILMGRAQPYGGIDIQRVDTRTGVGESLRMRLASNRYWSDGKGTIRITGNFDQNFGLDLTGGMTFRYLPSGSTDWRPFGKNQIDQGITPLVVDGNENAVYALQRLDGRFALYKVALDGSLKIDLVFAHPQVDVDGVETVGRDHRVIGARYFTDRKQVAYTDPSYQKLAVGLGKVLPQLPIISIEGASADERKLLIFAASDVDPGHYFFFDRDTHRLTELAQARPQLAQQKLAPQRSISFPAADGTMIPAYLMMPADAAGRKLPAIVLPHGGTSVRDVWGFNWIAQYFAARGYVVLQPEYRGSTGYGDNFRQGNSLKAWRVAVGDIADAGRWLVREGIADPGKLAIFGWTWGGYAALQVNYLDPNLFKAVVAVAPPTDLRLARESNRMGRSAQLVDQMFGTVANAVEGSPIQHADVFKAPVLIFHGDQDLYVPLDHSKRMDAALRSAGKQSQLVIYPGVDNGLVDAGVRADLLTQADNFIARTVGLGER